MVTSEQVREALKNRHAGDSWAYFEELRTHTGYSSESRSSLGYLDAYAIGLWKDNRGFIAYEIKQTRGDFMSDIEKFATKQAAALRNSTQFYRFEREDPAPSGVGMKASLSKKIIQKKEFPEKLYNITIFDN